MALTELFNYNSNEGENKIELWFYDEGYAIIFGTVKNPSAAKKSTYLIVSNIENHPSVIAPGVSFFNSNGSTGEYHDFPALNLDQVKTLMKQNAINFIFDQQH